jgi:hypothetical protein
MTTPSRVGAALLACRQPDLASFAVLTRPAGPALQVAQEARDAGVRVFSAGLESQRASVVATDGTVTDGPYPETKEVIGGFAVVEVPSREEALRWAAKIAAACRCAQEVPELGPDPSV